MVFDGVLGALGHSKKYIENPGRCSELFKPRIV